MVSSGLVVFSDHLLYTLSHSKTYQGKIVRDETWTCLWGSFQVNAGIIIDTYMPITDSPSGTQYIDKLNYAD